MQIRNLARFAAFVTVTLVTLAVPTLAQDVDRSALEVRTVADINAPAVVKAMAAKLHEESSAVVDNEHTTALQSMSRRDAALEKRFAPLAIAGIGMGVKAVGGIFKGIKKLIRKKKAKKAARKAAAAAAAAASASSGASAASEKRDVVHDEDAPITILDPRDFDFTGLTDGLAKGIKALGSIVKVFKDMKKKKQSDDAPVDDNSAAPAAGKAAAASEAYTRKAATGDTTGGATTGDATTGRATTGQAAAASQKRDVAHDEDAPVTALDPRDFDFTGLTDGIAKGVKALGKIVKVFKDMKKKKQSDGDTAPVDDSNAATATASKAGTGETATGKAATGTAATASRKRDVVHDESGSLSSAAEASSLEKRKTIVKRPVFWVA